MGPLGALCLPEPCYTDERPLVSRFPAQPGPGCVKTAAAPPQQGCNQLQTHRYETVNNIFEYC